MKNSKEKELIDIYPNNLNFTKAEENGVIQFIKEESDISFFEGHIENAYSLDFVKVSDKCPLCNSETIQYYSHFIYATQIAPRVLLAPAGYFCAKCPTVIINENMIKDGIKSDFLYKGVLGIDPENNKKPDFFKTWNGKTPIYIFDENETAMGLSTDLELDHKSLPVKKINKKVIKKKRKAAKKSRKRNRK